MVGIIVLIMASIISNTDSMKVSNLDMLAREYILKMESVGYLSAEDEKSLRDKLQTIGIRSVDLTGTTLSKVGYGKEIKLCIKGETEIRKFELKEFFKTSKTTVKIPVTRNKQSTAKH